MFRSGGVRGGIQECDVINGRAQRFLPSNISNLKSTYPVFLHIFKFGLS